MLLEFSVSNWRLITEEVSLSMQATKEQQHGDRLTWAQKFAIRILPNALIFGGNASGKSAFIDALEFMKDFVTDWNESFLSRRLEPNRFDLALREQPSRFSISLYLDGDLYDYSFSCTRKEVKEEKLTRSNSNSTYLIFSRLGHLYEFDESQYSKEDRERLHSITLGTDDKQLFLNNAIGQKMHAFSNLYEWFEESLVIIHPWTRISPFTLFNSEEVMDLYNRWLPYLDNGILRLEKEEITAKEANAPDALLDKLNSELLRDDELERVGMVLENFALVEVYRDREPRYFRIISVHEDNQGKEFRLMMNGESDGTRRMLDLIPAFCDKVKSKASTIVIDEIDRSLHSVLVQKLFSTFHNRLSHKVQDQIIASTHNLDLMTQSLFRRDEMWFFDRKRSGTELLSLADFIDTKKDKDVRKSYLEGRMGGLPRLQFEQIYEHGAGC